MPQRRIVRWGVRLIDLFESYRYTRIRKAIYRSWENGRKEIEENMEMIIDK